MSDEAQAIPTPTDQPMPLIPAVRNLDAIYIRVERDGKMTPRCLTDCTWREVHEWVERTLTEKEPHEIKRFCLNVTMHLHAVIQQMGHAFDLHRGPETPEN